MEHTPNKRIGNVTKRGAKHPSDDKDSEHPLRLLSISSGEETFLGMPSFQIKWLLQFPQIVTPCSIVALQTGHFVVSISPLLRNAVKVILETIPKITVQSFYLNHLFCLHP